MTQEKHNELLINLLVGTLAEMQIVREMTFAMLSNQLGKNEIEIANGAKGILAQVADRRNAIHAQIKLYYEGGFGSVDDLLSQIL